MDRVYAALVQENKGLRELLYAARTDAEHQERANNKLRTAVRDWKLACEHTQSLLSRTEALLSVSAAQLEATRAALTSAENRLKQLERASRRRK